MPPRKPVIEENKEGGFPLERYDHKRAPERTPEPFGGGVDRPRIFVVQQHDARRMHWDFRLELGGTLKSWAVPHGPSADPAEKRLAVHVEDHPVEYADFEGVIPAGNYGAGPVIVWDRGRWIALEDPVAGMERGKLLFELQGFKLRGVWTLVRTKRRGQATTKEWLLIKKPDRFASRAKDALPPGSVLSGLGVEELAEGSRRADEVRASLEAVQAPRAEVRAEQVELMLAELRERPFSSPGWLFELKYDGFRALAVRDEGRARLVYRSGADATAIYPDLSRALRSLPCSRLILDGEITVLDEQGRPSFHRLQQRAMLQRAADIERAMVELPAVLYLFDLIACDGFDLRSLPLSARKELLRRIVPRLGPLRFADHVEERGEELFEQVRAIGLEGLVAKRADAPYRGGRRSDWLKIRFERSGDFAVVGFTAPRGSRAGFGGLHLACWQAGSDGQRRLVYAGRVGSGFTQKQLEALRAELDEQRREGPACEGAAPQQGRENVWVEPRLVVEVRFLGWTADGLLRQPRLVRVRDDKPIEECEELGAGVELPARPTASTKDATRESPDAPESPESPESIDRKVTLSNLDKVFWPDEGYTKGDLLAYYREVAPWLLPFLRDRPCVLTRFPDGIRGKSFFQKDAPGFVPGWLRTERIFSPGAERDIDYFIIDDEPSLLYVINMGSIPLHVWASRLRAPERPDWCLIDLDPKGAPFAHVVTVALAVRALCDEMGLPSFAKTSGQAGLHILIPLGGTCTHEQSRGLAQLIARVIVDELPDLATVARAIPDRGGRVYLDWLQNGHGKLMASAYCARPVAGATVSMPLQWRDVGPDLDPSRYTIKSAPSLLRERGDDPMLPVLTAVPDLGRALERLGARIRR
jgi:bifunctional non-homologous end joining protein LigD